MVHPVVKVILVISFIVFFNIIYALAVLGSYTSNYGYGYGYYDYGYGYDYIGGVPVRRIRPRPLIELQL